MHVQAMREMAENGVLFGGVESNGGVMASKLNSFLVLYVLSNGENRISSFLLGVANIN